MKTIIGNSHYLFIRFYLTKHTKSLQKARAVSNDQLLMLLAGIDCWNILPVLEYGSMG